MAWPIRFGIPTEEQLELIWAGDFYEVIVDEAEERINYHFMEIESE